MPKVGITGAARVWGISASTVRQRIKCGEIPGERVPHPGGFKWMVDVPGNTMATRGTTLCPSRVAALKAQFANLCYRVNESTSKLFEIHRMVSPWTLIPQKPSWASGATPFPSRAVLNTQAANAWFLALDRMRKITGLHRIIARTLTPLRSRWPIWLR